MFFRNENEMQELLLKTVMLRMQFLHVLMHELKQLMKDVQNSIEKVDRCKGSTYGIRYIKGGDFSIG